MNNDTKEIKNTLLDILQCGLLNIRIYGESVTPELCVIEANHIHNIPSLLKDFSKSLLDFYLAVEVIEYEAKMRGSISSEMKESISKLKMLSNK
jgi:hypothetical protein